MTPRALLITALLSAGFITGCPSDREEPPVPPGPPVLPDGGTDPDAGTQEQAFSAFVIDLIQNKTADDTEPVAIPENLTHSEDPAQFDVLFP